MNTEDSTKAETVSRSHDGFVSKGNSYRLDYGKGHYGNKKIHVREIVDGTHVVYKWWTKRKQYWVYEVKSLYVFELYQRDGVIFKC